MSDAVVIGAGPNGLIAANLLADAGWGVTVLEASDRPGGAVRSAELTEPGFVHDVFSAFYPLAEASPIVRGFGLERYGLKWVHAPLVLAHPTPDGACAALSRDIDETAANLDASAMGDGAAWRELYGLWEKVGADLVSALFTPFPPIAPPARMIAKLRPKGFLDFARLATLPVRRLADERFSGPAGGLLLAGNALHSDLAPESVMSGFYGWLLTSLGQSVGYPVPKGGAGRLADALVARLEDKGGQIICDSRVTQVIVRDGTARAVRTEAGDEFSAARAILADVGAPSLFMDLVGEDLLPEAFLKELRRFQYDNGTVKLDWALSGPIPWKSEEARRAGTVHIARDMDQLTMMATQLQMQMIPERPLLVLGQMTTTDPTRSPLGTETAWAYAHVPQNPRGDAAGRMSLTWDERDTEDFAGRMEDQIEVLAPGFRDKIIGRHVMTPPVMESMNANLVAGAINGGTAQLHQTVIFRPTPGLARPETPIKNLYLASASAHPGGGVHGAPGANAAKAALWHDRRRRLLLPAAGSAAALLALRKVMSRGDS
jgi:phytoene dehydrogenase-like protein